MNVKMLPISINFDYLSKNLYPMKNLINKIITLLLTSFFAISLFANTDDKVTYDRILIKAKDNSVFERLAENNLYADHPIRKKEGYWVVFNNEEVDMLKSTGIDFEILIHDLEAYYQKRILKEMQDPAVQKMMKTSTPGFTLGNHAGYYVPSGVYNKMNEITTNYPNIAAPKVSIGTTHEGRNIFMLKISDNPNTDESATEPAVYYDAMQHAREPLSMMTLMYYMFWLVENYGTDPEATHIVNNRELFFVPIVNVDGYQYNITTNPFGGGLWRKNRTPNLGSGCVGTDLNRNYDSDWSLVGTSTNPCSDVFHGSNAFSEPETAVVRDFLATINPTIAFTCHSASEIYLESGWDTSRSQEEYYADYSLDMCEAQDYAYGQGEDILYGASGTASRYLNQIGAIAWTPEIGSDWWEPASEIITYAEKHLPIFTYAASIAGDYPDIKQVTINNNGDLLPGQTYNLAVEIFNKGRTQTANNVSVQVVNASSNVAVINSVTSVSSVPARQTAWTSTSPISLSIDGNASGGDIIEVELSLMANGVEYERETQRWVVGTQNILFDEDGSNGLGAFVESSTIIPWDTTFVMKRSGNECITDSRLEAAYNNSNTTLSMSNPVNLAGTVNPVLEFWIAWGMSNSSARSFDSPYEDNVKIELRQNGGAWNPISTDNTDSYNGQPEFVLNNSWAKQIVDLSPYIGSSVEFRFVLDASYQRRPDGVFIDDFRIVDYSSCGTEITFGNFPTSTSSTQPINLSASPPGGVFSGEGVVFNAFNPSLNGPGLYDITYTYQSDEACESEATIQILVFTLTFNFVNYNLGTISPKYTGQIDFQIEVPAEDVYTFEVFDVTGKRFASEQLKLNEGLHQQQLSLHQTITQGIYFVRISNSNGIFTKKFLR